jgi:glycosyltransferase involved in cell wall biosynthesis
VRQGGKVIRIVHFQRQLRGSESGTSNAARGWCEALARQGIEVVGLFDDADLDRPSPMGTNTVGLKHSLRGPLRTPHGVAQHVIGADVVVIHGGWLLGNIAVGRVCLRARVPFVITTHGVYIREVLQRRALRKRLWAVGLERRHLARAAAVHVFFPEEQESMEHAMKMHVPTIAAPNGITYSEGVAWDGRGGYLLWLGRFDIDTKGLDLLVRAIERIPVPNRPQLRLHGPDWRGQKDRVRSLVSELGIEPWVSVGDPIYGEEKWRLISNASACAYPSRWDACSVSVAEAAAVGVPILVTRYPLGNFLAAREAAIQVDPNASRIAEAIPRLLSSEAAQIGRNASIVARRELSWDAVAASWVGQVAGIIGA